jgi:hypothetical protein
LGMLIFCQKPFYPTLENSTTSLFVCLFILPRP